MLGRQPPSVWEFTAEEVKAMLRQGQEHHDIRWLVPLLEITSPLSMEVGDEEIGPLLEQFSSRGYLIPSDDRPGAYGFSPDLDDLVDSFLTFVSFFYFGISRWQPEDDAWVNTHFVAFRSLLTLWVVDYLDLESSAPVVNICSMSYDELREAMTELLLRPETEVEAQTCASCGAPLKPGKKFCTQCGAPLG